MFELSSLVSTNERFDIAKVFFGDSFRTTFFSFRYETFYVREHYVYYTNTFTSEFQLKVVKLGKVLFVGYIGVYWARSSQSQCSFEMTTNTILHVWPIKQLIGE